MFLTHLLLKLKLLSERTQPSFGTLFSGIGKKTSFGYETLDQHQAIAANKTMLDLIRVTAMARDAIQATLSGKSKERMGQYNPSFQKLQRIVDTVTRDDKLVIQNWLEQKHNHKTKNFTSVSATTKRDVLRSIGKQPQEQNFIQNWTEQNESLQKICPDGITLPIF